MVAALSHDEGRSPEVGVQARIHSVASGVDQELSSGVVKKAESIPPGTNREERQ
jgi:hypothetical protein